MKFVLEIDLDALAPDADQARELGRILRFSDGADLLDSECRTVGRWGHPRRQMIHGLRQGQPIFPVIFPEPPASSMRARPE